MTVSYAGGTNYSLTSSLIEDLYRNSTDGILGATKESVTGNRTWSYPGTANGPNLTNYVDVCIGLQNYGASQIAGYVFAYNGSQCNLSYTTNIYGWVSKSPYSAYLAVKRVYFDRNVYTVNGTMAVSQASPTSASTNTSYTVVTNSVYTGTGTASASFSKISTYKGSLRITVTRINGTSFSNTIYN